MRGENILWPFPGGGGGGGRGEGGEMGRRQGLPNTFEDLFWI